MNKTKFWKKKQQQNYKLIYDFKTKFVSMNKSRKWNSNKRIKYNIKIDISKIFERRKRTKIRIKKSEYLDPNQ